MTAVWAVQRVQWSAVCIQSIAILLLLVSGAFCLRLVRPHLVSTLHLSAVRSVLCSRIAHFGASLLWANILLTHAGDIYTALDINRQIDNLITRHRKNQRLQGEHTVSPSEEIDKIRLYGFFYDEQNNSLFVHRNISQTASAVRSQRSPQRQGA